MQPVPAPKLAIKRQDGTYQEREWDKEVFVVGRDATSDLIIDHVQASRRHARFERTETGFCVRDLNSTNGTYVNGERLGDVHHLSDQDRIVIADTIITFRDPEATARGPVPAELLRQTRDGEELHVDSLSKEVYIRGQIVAPQLTVKEFQLLELLYARKGQVVSKDEIARSVWDYEVFDYNAIDALVYRLRHRIEENPSNPRYLLTQRGFGYKLVTEPE